MTKITVHTDIADGSEMNISLAGSTVGLAVAGAMSTDGATGQAVFSALEDYKRSDANANKYRFWAFMVNGEQASQMEWRGGWANLDSTTIELIRDCGLRFRSGYSPSATVTKEWCCLVQSGSFGNSGSASPYVLLDTDTTPTSIYFTHDTLTEFNALVPIYDSGGDDDRGSMIIFERSEGYTYGYYDLTTEQAISSLLPIKYLIPMTTITDTHWTGPDATIAASSPYTGITCYTSITGTGFDAWANSTVYAANAVVSDGGRWYITTLGGTSSGTGVGDDVGVSDWSAYSGERDIDGTYYAFNKIIDGNSATKEQIWEKHQYNLRQTSDIDAGAGTQRGDTSPALLSWLGDTLVTATGVYVDSYQAAERAEYTFTDVGGTERSFAVTNTAATSGIVANSYLMLTNETGAAATAWSNGVSISAGDYRLRSTGRGTELTAGLYYRAQNSGTTGGSEPTFPTSPGGTVNDNGITWICMAIAVEDGVQASDWSLSYSEGEEFTTGDSYQMLITYQSGATYYKPLKITGIVGASGFTALVEQELWTDVNDWAIDGSAQTAYAIDGTNIDIDITGSGSGTKKSMVAWWAYMLGSDSETIFKFWNAYTVENSASIRQNVSDADVVIEKTSAGNWQFTDNDVRYYRSNFSSPYDTTGNSIFMDYSGVPLIKTTGGTSLTAAESAAVLDWADGGRLDTIIDAVKSKTDNFAFTVANQVDANIKSVSDDSTAADNLELMYDGTGYTDETAPASRAQVSSLVVSSGGISVTADSFTKAASEPETNTYASTVQLDGVYHIVEDDTGTTDVYYEFDIGRDGVPQDIEWWGYAQSQNDSYAVQAYNWVTTSWEQIGTIEGKNSTTEENYTFSTTIGQVGTGTNAGLVRIKFYSTDGTVIATDRMLCTYTFRAAGITNGSTITLAAATNNENLVGHNWFLALGGQNIAGSYFYQAIQINGTGVGTNAIPFTFQECNLVTCTLSAFAFIYESAFSDTVTWVSTAGGSDDNLFVGACYSAIPGTAAPTNDFSGVSKTTSINVRDWTGGGTWVFNAFCTSSIEVSKGGTHTITTGGGDVEFRGAPKAIVLTTSGSSTTNIIVWSGCPITINGTGGTVNVWGQHCTFTDNSTGTTVNKYGLDGGLLDTRVATIEAKIDVIDINVDQVETAIITNAAGADIAADIAALNNFNPATDILEGTETYEQAMRLIRAEAAGDVVVDGDNVKFKDSTKTKNRIDATTDIDGNRTNVIDTD